MLIWKLLRSSTCFDANDGAGSGGDNSNNDGGNAGGDGGNAGGGDTKTFLQTDVDKIVSDRLAREKKKIEADLKAALKAEADKAAMTEAEKLKADKEEAEGKASEATKAANARIINAEARITANDLGVKADKLAYVLKLADLSGVTVNDDGEPDAVAIKAAIEAVLKDLPELKTGSKQGDSQMGGGGFGGGNNGTDKPLTTELIGAMSAEETKRRMPEIKAFFAKK